jgi:hypothetical protein
MHAYNCQLLGICELLIKEAQVASYLSIGDKFVLAEQAKSMAQPIKGAGTSHLSMVL